MKSRKTVLIIRVIIIAIIVGLIIIWLRAGPTSEENFAAHLPVPGVTEGPIVSLNFDDGFASAFTIGMPIVNAAGFKTTHYIIGGSLKDPGYMTAKQVLKLEDQGHEIGAHTMTHKRLAQISLSEARDEIFESQEKLLDVGISKLSTFVYPHGDFNDEVIELVKEAGFLGARLTHPGLNDKLTDPYHLMYLGMNASTTFEVVKNKVDEAIVQEKWLIMVFHRIDEFGYENISNELLKQTIAYLKEKQVPVVTTAQGLFILKNIPH